MTLEHTNPLRDGARAGAADLPTSREFEDESGVRWKVFMVRPSATSRPSVINERFRAGWLSFASGAETRRLAPIIPGWERMTAAELAALLRRAEVARPGRRRVNEELGEAEQPRRRP